MSMRTDDLDLISDYLAREMADRCIPGLAVALTDRHRLIWTATFGFSDMSARHPVTPIHRFQIGSISKSFASIALLQLQEQGALSLDDPVTLHLPWFKVRSRYGPITLRHLMSHTAGIVTGTDSSPSAYSEVAGLSELETGSAPGSLFHYSNTGYKVLGLVLEEVTGKVNREVLEEKVIGPIGMDDTEAEITNGNRPSQPVGYTFLHNDRPQRSCPELVPSTWFESNTADGSIISTPADMAAYVRMLLNRGVCGVRRIISRRSFAMLTDQVAKPMDARPGEFYGLGLSTQSVGGRRVIGHTGGMVGFVSEIRADLGAGLGVVVLNNSRIDSSSFAGNVLRIARALRAGKRPPRIPRFDSTRVPRASEYTGTYRCGSKNVKVRASGRTLLLETGTDAVTLEFRGKDRFYANHPEFELFEIKFGRQGGIVEEMLHGPDWYRGPRQLSKTQAEHPETWNAYAGQYRSHNPWTPSFRVILRKGSIFFVDSTGEEVPMSPLEDGSFRLGGDSRSPERISFGRLVHGKATKAVLSGSEWNRVSLP